MKCVLSDSDRRTTGQYVQLVDAQGVDYFENLCLKNNQACKNSRILQAPRFGVSEEKVAQYVGLHYYTDKELQVTSEAACKLACEIENEFLCRSFLYLGQPNGQQYNCRLYHMDHKVRKSHIIKLKKSLINFDRNFLPSRLFQTVPLLTLILNVR